LPEQRSIDFFRQYRACRRWPPQMPHNAGFLPPQSAATKRRFAAISRHDRSKNTTDFCCIPSEIISGTGISTHVNAEIDCTRGERLHCHSQPRKIPVIIAAQ
jgi:hypothetical protein